MRAKTMSEASMPHCDRCGHVEYDCRCCDSTGTATRITCLHRPTRRHQWRVAGIGRTMGLAMADAEQRGCKGGEWRFEDHGADAGTGAAIGDAGPEHESTV